MANERGVPHERQLQAHRIQPDIANERSIAVPSISAPEARTALSRYTAFVSDATLARAASSCEAHCTDAARRPGKCRRESAHSSTRIAGIEAARKRLRTAVARRAQVMAATRDRGSALRQEPAALLHCRCDSRLAW
jgi:hypothetical protein